MKAVLPLAFALSLTGAVALAQPMPSCRVPPGAQPIAVPRGVPAPVMAAFRREFPVFAMPGQPFNATDVIGPGDPPAARRLDFAWRQGNRWALAMEQGGIAHFGQVIVYDGAGRELGRAQGQPNGQMCEMAARLLRGGGASGPRGGKDKP